MEKFCMIEVAFGKKEEAEKVISNLLDKKLVASCQMIESQSYWNWENSRESGCEYLLFLKTKNTLLSEIYKEIRVIHSYECFEFAVFPFDSYSKGYLTWIQKEVK